MRRSSLRGAAPKELHQMNFIKLIQNNPNMQHTNEILRKQKTLKSMKSTRRNITMPTRDDKYSNRSVDITSSARGSDESHSIISIRKMSYDMGSPTKMVKFDVDKNAPPIFERNETFLRKSSMMDSKLSDRKKKSKGKTVMNNILKEQYSRDKDKEKLE